MIYLYGSSRGRERENANEKFDILAVNECEGGNKAKTLQRNELSESLDRRLFLVMQGQISN